MNKHLVVGGMLLVATLSSCQVSHQSNFPLLSKRVQGRMMAYNPAMSSDTVVQELTAADVHNLSRQHAYTWVVVWAPWCGPWQQLVAEFKQQQQQLASRDINLVLVDIMYSPQTALGQNKTLRGERPGYVVNWRHYGDDADVKFRQELTGGARASKKMRYANHFIFNQQQRLVLKRAEAEMPFEVLDRTTGETTLAPGQEYPVPH